MSDLPQTQDDHVLEVPAFGRAPALRLDMASIRNGERRIVEAKNVTPITYAELEHSYNEAYRDLKRHLSSIGYQLAMAEKALKEARADIILGSYAEFLEGKPKWQNNADLREAFIIKDPTYSAALDRVNQLRALESNFDGKLKVFENVCRYMRQKMQLIVRNGLPVNIYNTQK